MGCGLHFIVILVYLFVNISPAVARHLSKRAEPFPKIHGSVTERTIKTTLYKEDRTVRSRAQCPIGHLPQTHENRIVCCRPVVCSSGFEIRTCSTDGGKDECVKCKTGYIQLDNISSFNMNETSCFQSLKKSHNQCPSDTKKSRHMPVSCWMYCECKIEACYVGNPCGCIKVDPCGINQQLNKQTEECEKCPPYSYKHTVGCEACTYNITAFSLGMQLQEEPDVTTQKGTYSSSELPSTEGTPWTEKGNQPTWQMIAMVVVGPVLVIIILLFVIAWHYRRSRMMRILRTKLCRDHSESSAMVSRVAGSREREDDPTSNVDGSSSVPLLGNHTESDDQAQTELSVKNLKTTPNTSESEDSGFKSSQEITALADPDQGESSIHDGVEIVPGELDSITETGEISDQTFSKEVVNIPTDTSREQDMVPRDVVAAGGEVIVRERVIEMCDKSVDNQYSLQQEKKPKAEKPIAIIPPLARRANSQGHSPRPEVDDSIGNSSVTSYGQVCLSSMRMRFDQFESQEPNPSLALGVQPEPHLDDCFESRESADGQSESNQYNSVTIPKQIFLNENTNRKSVMEESDRKAEKMEGKQEQTKVAENDSSLPSLPSDDISYEIPLCDEPSDSVEIELDRDGATGQALENNETHELTLFLSPTGERERGDGEDNIETETDASVEIDITTNI